MFCSLHAVDVDKQQTQKSSDVDASRSWNRWFKSITAGHAGRAVVALWCSSVGRMPTNIESWPTDVETGISLP